MPLGLDDGENPQHQGSNELMLTVYLNGREVIPKINKTPHMRECLGES